MKRILFITWDGPETNYVQSLFMPIFVKLQAKYEHQFHIIQFTWGDPERIEKTRDLCQQNKIPYKSIKVFRKHAGLGVLKAVQFQSKEVQEYIRTNNIDVVVPRGTTSAAIVNHIYNKIKASYLFDADGFSQDERVDFGSWNPLGLQYRIYRDIEFKALHLAKGILVRSHKAKEVLAARAGAGFSFNKVQVITNGKDVSDFHRIRGKDNNSEGIKFIYVGSLGPQYKLKEMLNIFKEVLRLDKNATFSILTGNVRLAEEYLLREPEEVVKRIILKTVEPSAVPAHIQTADVAFALREASFSMKGVAPIKIGEYLLCGVPVIASKGVGDTEMYLKDSKAAFLVDQLGADKVSEIVKWCLNISYDTIINDEARKIGETYFDINQTVEAYQSAIECL